LSSFVPTSLPSARMFLSPSVLFCILFPWLGWIAF
jgi:hypothetical protein